VGRLTGVWHGADTGKTSLARVFWLYGLLGSIVVSAIGLAFDSSNVFAMRSYTLFGLLFSVYVTIGTYQCAGNCGIEIPGPRLE
jgi:hypothetical protein